MRRSARSSQWSALNVLGAIRVVAIVLRAEFRCTYCAIRPPKGRRHTDHVVPRSEGGSDRPDNLVLSCADCNLERRWEPDEVPDKAFRYGRTREEIDLEIARQTSISIEPGTELYERARAIAPVWYPEHFARKARARAAWFERNASTFNFGAEAA